MTARAPDSAAGPALTTPRTGATAPARTVGTVGTELQRLPARRAFEIVCERIRAQVACGELRPGDKLPPERELTDRFGVSRAALREALRSLENAGVIELQRGAKGGAFITGGSQAKLTEMMQDMLHLGRFALSDLSEARIHFLDSVVRLACERATEAELDALEASLHLAPQLDEDSDRAARMRQAAEFYSLLAASTRNKVMMLVVQSLTDILLSVMQAGRFPPSDSLQRSRRRVLAALRARRADQAAAALRAHLDSLHRHMQHHAAASGSPLLSSVLPADPDPA